MNLLASRKFFVQTRRKYPARKLFFAIVVSLFAAVILLVWETRFIDRQTEHALEIERRKLFAQNLISFSKADLTPHRNQNVQIIQSTRNVRAVAAFQNSLYAATDGGLLELDENGAVVRHLTVLDGLPESDLTTLAAFRSKLMIGTKSKGLLEFDGEKFTAFRFEQLDTKSITTFLINAQKLLVGTFAGGLLEYDGAQILEIRAAGARIEHITFLRATGGDLLVGTFDDGLWVRQNQIWKHFRKPEGLLSDRVVDAEIHSEKLFVATDLGVAEAIYNELSAESAPAFRQVCTVPALSGFVLENESFYVTRDDGEIYKLAFDAGKTSLKKISAFPTEKLQSARLVRENGAIFFLSDRGIRKSRRSPGEELSFVDFTRVSVEYELSDNNVSALTIDSRARLWIGTFRRGIDVFSAEGKKLKRIESSAAREINSFSIAGDEVIAATSGGALRFGGDLLEKTLIENTDLPSRSVSQALRFVDRQNESIAAATAKGLFFAENGARRIFTAANDLPANGVYSVLSARGALFVGTMSGLAEIRGGKVARVYKSSNSELKNNWISALCAAGDRVFVGTYGGGIYELLASGEIQQMNTGETERKIFVNPNALFADGESVYAGTLDGALRIDFARNKAQRVRNVLPSETVLAVTGDREHLYFGTTGGVARLAKAFFDENQASF